MRKSLAGLKLPASAPVIVGNCNNYNQCLCCFLATDFFVGLGNLALTKDVGTSFLAWGTIMQIKSVLLATAFAFAGISGANAADAIQYQEPVAAPVQSFSWGGAYLGGQIGYGWGKSRFSGPDFPDQFKPDGFLGGLYAGYNFDLGNNVILGVDGDITYNNLKDSESEDFGGIVIGSNTKLRWSGAVRARAGVAVDRFLPYIAGGVAFGSVRNNTYFDVIGFQNFSSTDTKTMTGWTIGAGVDYAATDNLIVRLEYRYTDYGRKDFSGTNDLFSFETGNKLKTSDIRLGVAYKF